MNRHAWTGIQGWRVLVAVFTVLVPTGLSLGVGVGAASGEAAAPAGSASPAQTPPFWCQWIPDPWKPPECLPTTTTTTAPPTTSTTAPPSTTTTQPPGTTTTTTPGSTTTAPPGESVDAHFSAQGPAAVITGSGTDGSGATYTLFYPANLASDGVDNPMLTYGNGTGATCTDGNPTQGHMASWGFVVVCPNTGTSGWGTEMWAGVQFMVAQDDNPASVFYQQLDTVNIGALGHSQGATGAANATVLANGTIRSTVSLALVNPFLHFPANQLPAFDQIDTPILLLSGTTDLFTSQPQQQAYFDQVAGPAAKAGAVNKDHAGMIPASLGYAAAWFKYTLQGDQFARQAFVGSPPQINTNPAWTNQAEKNLS